MNYSPQLEILLILIPFATLITAIAYSIGKRQGQKLIRQYFSEVIIEIQKEKEERDEWIKNGSKLNKVPRIRFGLTSVRHDGLPDFKFEVTQQMGEDILNLINSRNNS